MINVLFTDGKQLLRIVKYVHPTPSTDGYFILSRGESGCEVTLDEFLTKWKVFNAHAAFADYLFYSEQVLSSCKDTDFHNTLRHMMQWVKGRSIDTGGIWATTVTLSDLEYYLY